jgi:Asp-tRNA(Asn)/Glu-tRNA(Gln) amidotransferase B subunit
MNKLSLEKVKNVSELNYIKHTNVSTYFNWNDVLIALTEEDKIKILKNLNEKDYKALLVNAAKLDYIQNYAGVHKHPFQIKAWLTKDKSDKLSSSTVYIGAEGMTPKELSKLFSVFENFAKVEASFVSIDLNKLTDK